MSKERHCSRLVRILLVDVGASRERGVGRYWAPGYLAVKGIATRSEAFLGGFGVLPLVSIDAHLKGDGL